MPSLYAAGRVVLYCLRVDGVEWMTQLWVQAVSCQSTDLSLYPTCFGLDLAS